MNTHPRARPPVLTWLELHRAARERGIHVSVLADEQAARLDGHMAALDDEDEVLRDEGVLDVLIFAAGFPPGPQVGTPHRMSVRDLALYLSLSTVGTSKNIAGGWSPARYRDNVRRKANIVHVCALVLDVDEGGDVQAVANVLDRYAAIVHSTFSSTPEAPRCRAVLPFAAPVDVPTYERAHAVVGASLKGHGVTVDAGAKDASRLSFAPVIKPGATFQFRETHGKLLDASAVLAAHAPRPTRRRTPRPAEPRSQDRYHRAAMRRAAEAVFRSTEGSRHATLNREAYALARLGLEEDELDRALSPAFVAAAGQHRAHECRRTIRDAVAARRRAR
jgi:hypothetical protein